ncbi:MAG: hypothetical protein V7K55_02190 [Nostoc sp.]|uniref:hypothetical protein n=1 Tax=Nostoc sp. TaxID=1180 RepID=UPI002FF88AF7
MSPIFYGNSDSIAYQSGNNSFVDYRYSKKKLTLGLPLGASFAWQNGISIN